MKKITSIISILTLILSTTAVFAVEGTEYGQADKNSNLSLIEGLNDAKSQVVNSIIGVFDISMHWAKDYIEDLIEKKLLSGYPDGTFRPDDNILVSEFSKSLHVLLEGEDVGNSTTGNWYDKYVQGLIELEIIKESEFRKSEYNREITREEMARMIIRALEEDVSTGRTSFKDDSKIGSEFKGYVKRAVELKIIEGNPDNTFKPKDNATRAEASKLLAIVNEIFNEQNRGKEKEEEKNPDFIKPDFLIEIGERTNYVFIMLDNWQEYEESSDEYEIRYFSTSHPDLNWGYYYDLYGTGEWYKSNLDKWTSINKSWKWSTRHYLKAGFKDENKYKPELGEVVELEITIRNKTKEIEKVYNKEFEVETLDVGY